MIQDTVRTQKSTVPESESGVQHSFAQARHMATAEAAARAPDMAVTPAAVATAPAVPGDGSRGQVQFSPAAGLQIAAPAALLLSAFAAPVNPDFARPSALAFAPSLIKLRF